MVAKLKEKDTEKLARLVKDIRSKEFKYEPREEKPIDWNSYNEAQINEINDYLTITKQLIEDIRAHIGKMPKNAEGRPPKDCYDKAKIILAQQFFECSNRVAAGLAKLFKEKLGIEQNFAYKDIERAYENVHVMLVLKLVLEYSNSPVRDRETVFAIDGSGKGRSIKDNYESDKNHEENLSKYDKFIGVIGCTYQLYSAVKITKGEANECPFLIPLMEETRKLYEKINLVTADAAFLSRANCSYIEGIGAVPRIFPKENVTLNARGSFAWTHMLYSFINFTQEWLRDFHIRSISETGNSVHKLRFPRPLLKRLNCRRNFELFSKICCYNVRRLVYVHYLTDVKVKWLCRGG